MDIEDRHSKVASENIFLRLRPSVWALTLAGVSFGLISSWDGYAGCGGGYPTPRPPANNLTPSLTSGSLDPGSNDREWGGFHVDGYRV